MKKKYLHVDAFHKYLNTTKEGYRGQVFCLNGTEVSETPEYEEDLGVIDLLPKVEGELYFDDFFAKVGEDILVKFHISPPYTEDWTEYISTINGKRCRATTARKDWDHIVNGRGSGTTLDFFEGLYKHYHRI